MDERLNVLTEQALLAALEARRNPRAEFSSDVGPALRTLRLLVEEMTLDSVRHARESRGNSWIEIATGLRMTRQGATRKYGDRVA